MPIRLRKNPGLLEEIARAMEKGLHATQIVELPSMRSAGVTAKRIRNVWQHFGGRKNFPTAILDRRAHLKDDSSKPALLSEQELEQLARSLRKSCLVQPAIATLNATLGRKLTPLEVVEFIQKKFGSMTKFRAHYGLK